MNSDILGAAEESQGEKVSNNCYRPSVCSVLGEGEVVAEVAMVVAFQSSGLLKRGRSMHGQRYGGALRVEKEKTERGEEKKEIWKLDRQPSTEHGIQAEKNDVPLARRRAHACRVRSRALSNAPPHRTHAYAPAPTAWMCR